jgi:hypothetical protein
MEHGERLSRFPIGSGVRVCGLAEPMGRIIELRFGMSNGVFPQWVYWAARFCLNHLRGERILAPVDVSPIAEFGGKVSLRQRQHPVTPHRQTRGEGHRAFFVVRGKG